MAECGIATAFGPGQVEMVWQKDGLAVTRAYLTDRRHYGPWAITHLATGYAVMGCWEKRTAIVAARFLLKAGDWTRPMEETIHDKNLKERVREARALYS